MAYTKEQRIINSMGGSSKKQRNEKKEKSEGFVLPNKSGDHYRSYKRDTPTQDIDLVNKKYVDDEQGNHDIADHNDTTAMGTELNTLTDDSMADTLHRHSELSASDGTPNPALSVDASGNVGIGTDSPTHKLNVVGDVNITGKGYFDGINLGSATGAGTADLYSTKSGSFSRWIMTITSDTSWHSQAWQAKRARGTEGSETAVQDGDWLFNVNAQGHDGDGYYSTSSGRMSIRVDGSVSNDVVPGKIIFETQDTSGNLNTVATFGADKKATFAGKIDVKGDISLESGSGTYKSNDGSSGVSGTFEDNNGNTVTVKNGIITDLGV